MDASPRQTLLKPRRLLGLCAALVTLAALPASASAAATVARPADSFVDSIGVNTHTYYTDTPYHEEFGTVKQRLRELGIRHIRENLVVNRPDQYEMLNELAAQGQRSTVILGEPDNGKAGLDKLVGIVGDELRGSVAAVEGTNEWDLNGPSSWMGELASYQAQLYSTVKSNPAVSALPVLGPSLGNNNSDATNISGSLDFGNIHSYPNAEEPGLNLSRLLGMATEMSGSKQVMATETGYHTAVNDHGEHRPISEAAQATYVPRLFLEYYRRGIVRTFSYELLDEFSDPGLEDSESNFGLLRNDLSPKPAFSALRNMIAILADPGAGFTPGRLDYTVSGGDDELEQLLLQKRDGSFYLALWREDRIWDKNSLVAKAGSSGTVKLSFGGTIDGAEEFAPNSSSQPLRKLPGGDSLSVNVGSQVVILRIGSNGNALGSIKVWVDEPAVETGDPVAVEGKLAGTEGKPRKVKIQLRGKKGWKTVAKTRTKANGRFKKKLRLLTDPGSSRIRVIAARAKPSNQVRVRVLARDGGAPQVGLADAQKS